MRNDRTPLSLPDRLRDPNDQQAKNRLVEFCQGYFLFWARKFLHNDRDVEDYLQELFLKVLREVPRLEYDPSRRFRGWLFTLARNLAFETRAKIARRPEQGLSAIEIADSESLPKLEDEEFNAFVMQRARDIVQTDFDANTWKAFELLTFAKQKPADVAAALGISVASVYNAKSRVLKRLREELQDLLD